MKEIKNFPASVKARLLNIAREEKISFNLLLLRYFHERFLFRLSKSPYNEKFVLKGGALFYVWEGGKSRVTKDLDFLSQNIKSSIEQLMDIIRMVCKVPYEPDGVTFDLNSLEAKEIMEEKRYGGIRITLNAYLGKAKQKLQIDFGFGDKVTPGPQEIQYPIILKMDGPKVLGYTVETVIAEKFESMIYLGPANSRMKDFYDIHHLLKMGDYSSQTLKKAIVSTFKQRKTTFSKNHSLFTEAFANEKSRINQWKSWITKIELGDEIAFEEVMATIKETLEPIYLENISD